MLRESCCWPSFTKIVLGTALLAACTDARVIATAAEGTDTPLPSGPRRIEVREPYRTILHYDDGEPVYLCGAGGPEEFFYLGERATDGTRVGGEQLALIDRLVQSGANAFYVGMVRSHGGDGEADHNPFLEARPGAELNEAMLAQWDSWLSQLDQQGIVTMLFVYDDGSRPWNTGDEVSAEERRFVTELVNRFEHLGLVIWTVAELYSETYSTERIVELVRVIREADDHAHPVAVHGNTGVFPVGLESTIDQYAYIETGDASAAHSVALDFRRRAAGKFGLNAAEAKYGDFVSARRRNWALAMASTYTLNFDWDVRTAPEGALESCGQLARFMEEAPYAELAPYDADARGSTLYAMRADSGSFLLYGEAAQGLGLADVEAGRYDLSWLDVVTGLRSTSVLVAEARGDVELTSPFAAATDLAVLARRH
jgi:hypothetical protein